MLNHSKFFIHGSQQFFKRIKKVVTSYFFKLCLLLFVLASMIYAGQTFSLFPIRYVKIVGSNSVEFNTSLRQTIDPFIKNQTKHINLSMLESQLKQWTCVERIVLWNILPYTLIIHLTVREPIALFQANNKTDKPSTQWMDNTGFLFHSSLKTTATQSLPRLIGSYEQSNQLLRYYQAFGVLLKPYSLKITTIHLDGQNRCTITLSNNLELLLGHFDPVLQLQKLLDVHPFALHQNKKIKKLDLRYPNGMAITFCEDNA